MAKILMGGKVMFEFPNLILDEFIPVVELNKKKFETDFGYGFLGPDTVEVILSSHINENLRKITPRVANIDKRMFKLPFTLKKGNVKTSDLDGIVDVKLSVADPEIKITSPTSFKTQYGETIEIELEIKKNTNTEFYIDFYANDDDDDLNKGELKDLHCGRMKIKFELHSTMVIIVGTDSNDSHKHKSEDNFIKRVDRILNTQTIENLSLSTVEEVYVFVPPSMSSSNIIKLNTYGRSLKQYQVIQKNAAELIMFLNRLRNIRSLIYFGHGIQEGPLYEYGVARLPDPADFNKSSFLPDATAYFMTCNSKEYAEKFSNTLGINSIGVEGTTYYGTEEISAGKLTKKSIAGTSIAWRYEVSSSGVTSKSYSLSQINGEPFLRKK